MNIKRGENAKDFNQLYGKSFKELCKTAELTEDRKSEIHKKVKKYENNFTKTCEKYRGLIPLSKWELMVYEIKTKFTQSLAYQKGTIIKYENTYLLVHRVEYRESMLSGINCHYIGWKVLKSGKISNQKNLASISSNEVIKVC